MAHPAIILKKLSITDNNLTQIHCDNVRVGDNSGHDQINLSWTIYHRKSMLICYLNPSTHAPSTTHKNKLHVKLGTHKNNLKSFFLVSRFPQMSTLVAFLIDAVLCSPVGHRPTSLSGLSLLAMLHSLRTVLEQVLPCHGDSVTELCL